MDIRQLIQVSFLVAASTILFFSSLPALKTRFVTYGSRASGGGPKEKRPGHPLLSSKDQAWLSSRSEAILDRVTRLQVPHEWFLHFYVVSVLCSVFWGTQIVSKGSLLVTVCENTGAGRSISMDQVALMWSLMAIQGVRRLAESVLLGKSSASKMWFVHWILGILFYIATTIAVWIEGAETLLHTPSPLKTITISAPSIRTMIGLPLFLLASGIQNDCHTYLASLPKYTLPDHPIFHTMVCPHYTAECVIYLSLAIIGAPDDAWINRTVFNALVFVVCNLAVTASTTKEWYIAKFGREKVGYRWRMIPFIF
ncbi:MAG: hypothetical protein Q9168_005851 [Polycauliona sp. 1 TL-2023]